MGPAAKAEMSKGQKEKTVLTALLAVIVLVAYFHLLLRPAVTELKGLAPKVNKMRRDLSAAKTLIKSKVVIESRSEELNEKIAELEKVFPREREVPKLLENFSKIAGVSGVRIIGIKPVVMAEPAAREENAIYQAIPIEIIARSGYHELGKFLEKLETGERFIRVKDLAISAKETSVKRHDVRLIAETYILVTK
jgi:Tfp pilus assembly protein PilO